jgi:hypothetical protein
MIKKCEITNREFKNGTRKHLTNSELIVIKETNEIYIILYSSEYR